MAASEGFRNGAEVLTNHLELADRAPYRGSPKGRVKYQDRSIFTHDDRKILR
jgi:hypothetical protein